MKKTSKKTQQKIDALKKENEGNSEINVQEEEISENTIDIPAETELDNVIGVIPVADIDLEGADCPLIDEAAFRLYGVFLPVNQSLRNESEMIKRFTCTDYNKQLINRFIEEDRFSYVHILFDGERYGKEEISTFVIIGQTDYRGLPYMIFDQSSPLRMTEGTDQLKKKLKYDLSERINTLQFLVKNIEIAVDGYFAGSENDFSELRLNFHKEVRDHNKK